jgi:hypothetical protein
MGATCPAHPTLLNLITLICLMKNTNWWSTGWTIGVLGFYSWLRLGIFLFTTASRTTLGAHPVSYPMGTRGSFPGGKAAGAWSWPHTSI